MPSADVCRRDGTELRGSERSEKMLQLRVVGLSCSWTARTLLDPPTGILGEGDPTSRRVGVVAPLEVGLDTGKKRSRVGFRGERGVRRDASAEVRIADLESSAGKFAD